MDYAPTPPDAWRTVEGATDLRKNIVVGGYDARPTATGGKEVFLNGWQQDIPLDGATIESWKRADWLGTSAATRHTPALDIDFDDADAADLAEKAFIEMLDGGRAIVRTGRAPRRAVLCRTDEPFKKIWIILQSPEGKNHKAEFLGDGQQIVLYGDRHDIGRHYTWRGGEPGSGPGKVARDELPLLTEDMAWRYIDKLAKTLGDLGWTEIKRSPKSNGHDNRADHRDSPIWNGGGQPTHEGRRRYAEAALIDECDKLEMARPTERNHELFKSSIRMAQLVAAGAMNRAKAEKALFDACIANGLDKDDAGPQGVRRTILSGFSKGLREPRTIPDRSYYYEDDEPVDEISADPAPLAPLGEWDAGLDTTIPPPRSWLLGNIFCRQFASSIFGDGAVGKTSVRYAQYLSLASAKPCTGEHIFQRCRVLIVSLEDGAHELQRRLLAARLHHNIDLKDLEGWLFLAAPGLDGGRLLETDKKGRLVLGGLADKLSEVIVRRKIDLVSLDPLVKLHAVGENDNTLMDKVASILTGLAIKHNIAVDVPHHMVKGPHDPGNAKKGRGAGATKDAFRLIYTLTPMSSEEAERFGLSGAERRYLIRMDSGKVNIAPPSEDATWFRLVGVRIGNGNEQYPNGDEVQTVERWTPPKIFADVSVAMVNQILNEIDTGLSDGNRYTDAPKATERAAWRVVVKHLPDKPEAAARRMVAAWRASGLLTIKMYENPGTRKEVTGLWVDDSKRP